MMQNETSNCTGAEALQHCRNCTREAVSYWLKVGAKPNLADAKGETALSLARANSNLRTTEALRKAGAKDVAWG